MTSPFVVRTFRQSWNRFLNSAVGQVFILLSRCSSWEFSTENNRVGRENNADPPRQTFSAFPLVVVKRDNAHLSQRVRIFSLHGLLVTANDDATRIVVVHPSDAAHDNSKTSEQPDKNVRTNRLDPKVKLLVNVSRSIRLDQMKKYFSRFLSFKKKDLKAYFLHYFILF